MSLQIEMTDTFGGETNYSWVTRKEIENDELPDNYTRRQLLKLVREKLELGSVKLRLTADCGDFLRYDLNRCAICVMITEVY